MVIVLSSTMVMNTNRSSYKLDSPTKDYNNVAHYQYNQHPPPHYQQTSMNYNNWYVENPAQHNATITPNQPHYEEPTANNSATAVAKPTGDEGGSSCLSCFNFSDCRNADSGSCCGGIRDDRSDHPASYNNGGSNNHSSTSNVLASYGMYGSSNHQTDEDDEDGFVPRSNTYRYHHSVVNISGSATSTNILRNSSSRGFADRYVEEADKAYACCFPTTLGSSCCSKRLADTETPAVVQDALPTTTTPEGDACCNSWCRPTILLLLLVLLVVVFVLISGILLCFNYIIYKPRTPIVEEPCEKTYCQFGADCVTRPDGSAHCECPTSCSTVFTPVCGTDGVTYSNHCLMRMRACQESENIRAQYSGECGAQPRPKGRRG